MAMAALFSNLAWGQVEFRTIADLPGQFNEISGMESADSSYIYAMNDGGNAAEIYRIDTLGDVVSTSTIQASNTDWEDLTSSKDQLFIGDFGNNGNSRKNLRVLILDKKDLVDKAVLQPKVIEFTYSDQTQFPPASNALYFDCEAFAYHNDSLYLFTKNRTNPYDGWSFMYVMPAKEGNHTAVKIDSVMILGFRKELGWITSADIHQKQLMILGSSFALVWNINTKVRLNATPRRLDFGHFSQKEALCILDNQNFLTSDEKFTGLGGPRLFGVEWDGAVMSANADFDPSGELWVHGDNIFYKSSGAAYKKLEIYDLNGNRALRQKFKSGSSSGSISIDGLKNGTYFAIIENDNGFKKVMRFIRMNEND